MSDARSLNFIEQIIEAMDFRLHDGEYVIDDHPREILVDQGGEDFVLAWPGHESFRCHPFENRFENRQYPIFDTLHILRLR